MQDGLCLGKALRNWPNGDLSYLFDLSLVAFILKMPDREFTIRILTKIGFTVCPVYSGFPYIWPVV